MEAQNALITDLPLLSPNRFSVYTRCQLRNIAALWSILQANYLHQYQASGIGVTSQSAVSLFIAMVYLKKLKKLRNEGVFVSTIFQKHNSFYPLTIRFLIVHDWQGRQKLF